MEFWIVPFPDNFFAIIKNDVKIKMFPEMEKCGKMKK